MKRRHHNSPVTLLILLGVIAGAALLAGCSDDSAVSPDVDAAVAAPILPDPAQLEIALDLFAPAAGMDKAIGQQNFFNAYLRAVIVGAMTDLVLAPPVSAFSLALHTVPSRQRDGSWVWVYTWVDGADEAQVRLTGRAGSDADGSFTSWEMRVSIHDVNQDLDDVLWFDGVTRREGRQGSWTFYDDDAAAALLDWQSTPGGRELRLEALLGEDAGDVLSFRVDGAQHRIDFVDGDSAEVWFIRWDETDGSGSLMVPDYNSGREACWDAQQYDVDCE